MAIVTTDKFKLTTLHPYSLDTTLSTAWSLSTVGQVLIWTVHGTTHVCISTYNGWCWLQGSGAARPVPVVAARLAIELVTRHKKSLPFDDIIVEANTKALSAWEVIKKAPVEEPIRRIYKPEDYVSLKDFGEF
jgi:hypothetical protein